MTTTDLAAQIRAKLAAMRHNAQKRGIDADEERDERLWRLSGDTELVTAALLAVLDLHAPDSSGDCPKCVTVWPEGVFHETAPCGELKAVAKALGIDEEAAT